MLRFDEAKNLLEPLHGRDTADTEISYYLGIAYDGLDDTDHARIAYEQAERLPPFYAASALRLGELLARRGDFAGAEQHLSGALRIAPDDLRIREELVAVRQAAENRQRRRRQRRKSRSISAQFLPRDALGNPDLPHLADDPDRVLNRPAGTCGSVFIKKLSTFFPGNIRLRFPYESEPGALAPQDSSDGGLLSGLLSGETWSDGIRLLRPRLQDVDRVRFSEHRGRVHSASRGSTGAAFRCDCALPAGHVLLFSRHDGFRLGEWSKARKFGPGLPVLNASTGLALLHVKNDPEHALSAFRDGLQSDPTNIAIYLGIDQALSLLNRPARERVEALEKYPKLDAAPPGLIFELALNLAEAGDFERATSLFHNRFFAREEGGTNVRQVWIEVQLQRAIASAKEGHCDAALLTVQHLGSEVSGLDFTRDGLDPFVRSARTNYLLGRLMLPAENQTKPDEVQLAAAASAPDQIRWACRQHRKCRAITSPSGRAACNLPSMPQRVAVKRAHSRAGGCASQVPWPRSRT